MGSYIYLSLGGLEVDWGKNEGFINHSSLFQKSDLAKVPYRYADSIVQRKIGLSKPLKDVADRLGLLGYTVSTAHRELSTLADFHGVSKSEFPAHKIAKAISVVDVTRVLSADPHIHDFLELMRCAVLPKLGIQESEDDFEYSEIGTVLRSASANLILRLLYENAANHDMPVTWQFSDIVSGGYARRRDFLQTLDSSERFLIVTEGSSDARILRHAFRLLTPHIADFFDFVDMEEGYPFTGTGNLLRFIQGLIGIGIQNKVVTLFDNDAEGVASHRRATKLRRPANMAIMKLPDLACFREFPTTGPHGRRNGNINGRAAAIECYLDLGKRPVVRWTSFNGAVDRYQGELVNKGHYTKQFLALRVPSQDYDTSRMKLVLNSIVSNCVAIAERTKSASLKRTY